MRKRHVNFICIDRFGYMFYQHRGRTELACCEDQWCVFVEDEVMLRSDEGTASMEQPCLGLISQRPSGIQGVSFKELFIQWCF